MISIIAGGKKSTGWVAEACAEYEQRLRRPFNVKFEHYEEEKLEKLLEKWPWERSRHFVIITDERGQNISSPALSAKLQSAFSSGREVVIIIGGAYGVSPEARQKADFLWSFSQLVFPHMLMRAMLYEQIYRAESIAEGGKYHHA